MCGIIPDWGVQRDTITKYLLLDWILYLGGDGAALHKGHYWTQ